MNSPDRLGKPVRRALRARVAAAFRKIARATDGRTAYRKTLDFYRSSGAAWTLALS